MQTIENLMLIHPVLISMNTERILVALIHVCLILCGLFFTFNAMSRWPSWSLHHGKYLRLSWLSASLAMMVQAYDVWHHPEQKSLAYPWVEIPLLVLWFFFLCILAPYFAFYRDEEGKLRDIRNKKFTP